jgi:hypothetical protein
MDDAAATLFPTSIFPSSDGSDGSTVVSGPDGSSSAREPVLRVLRRRCLGEPSELLREGGLEGLRDGLVICHGP